MIVIVILFPLVHEVWSIHHVPQGLHTIIIHVAVLLHIRIHFFDSTLIYF